MRDMIRWGEFRLRIGDVECTLQAYKSDPHEERLFIPFKDTTSGKETYGAGRYLDLDYQRDRTPEGKWSLDLNRAYNPLPIAQTMCVHLCLQRTGLRCQYMPVKGVI